MQTMEMTFGERLELMKRMEAATGADIAGDAPNGLVAGLRVRAAALRCADCPHTEACLAWLDGHAQGGHDAPHFCANRHLMRPQRAHGGRSLHLV